MYHALVRQDEVWTSFGIHVPSSRWSDIYNTLRRAFGEDNVKSVFWEVEDTLANVSTIAQRIGKDLIHANQA